MTMNDTASDDLKLAAEFPPATQDQWRQLVDGVLKGAPFDKKLVGRTYDGLRIEPLYGRAAKAVPVAGRQPGAPWQVVQRVDLPDPARANEEALHELENGATGLSLVFAGSIGAYGFGLPPGPDALARVLDNIYVDAGIALDFDLSVPSREMPLHFAAWVKARGVDPASTHVRFGFDPVRSLAHQGVSPLRWPELAGLLVKLVRDLEGQGFRGPFAVADARVIHNAGGSEAQELAYALASAVAYLRALEQGGIALDDARRMIFFRLTADADQFLTTAKFRALRKLWARVEQACGLTPRPTFVAAETAWRMTTKNDPYVNLLRSTIAVVGAGFGGADAVNVLPFTLARGLPDRFARRVARNTQLILLEESHLAKVADPAAGAGGIEDLTDKLCVAAWTQFQEIEQAGGIFAALETGLIQRKVATVRAERQAAIAKRQDALTGVSEYPHLKEAPVEVLDMAPVALPVGGPVLVSAEPLPWVRLAAPFEVLRDASDRMLAASGARPKVFLANLGTAADFTARASFAANLFEAGGIEAISFSSPLPTGSRIHPTSGTQDLPISGKPEIGGERSTAQRSGEGERSSTIGSDPSPGPSPAAPNRPLPMGEVKEDPSALAAAFKASGAKLACIASSDAVYAAQAAETAKSLVAAGAMHVYLAGRPGESEAELKAAGVQSFIYAGGDVLATLTAAHDILGLTPGR